jgi:hypothetical protein
MNGRIQQALVIGSASGLQIKAHDNDKCLFVEANWPAHPDIQTSFTLELLPRSHIEDRFTRDLLAQHKSRVLIREVPGIGQTFSIRYDDILWRQIAVGPDTKRQFAAASRRAKADKQDRLSVNVIDGKPCFDRSNYCFARSDVDWLMRKSPTALRVTTGGLLGATIAGIWGEYVITLRGFEN